VDSELRAILDRFPGRVGLVLQPLPGTGIRLREDEEFPAASTIKLFIMGAILDAGADLNERLPLLASEVGSGSGVLKDLTPGIELPLKDLLTLMITISDNTATNLLLERFGFPFFQSYLQKQGWRGTRIERKLSHPGSADWTGANRTTPRDLADFLIRLWQGDLLPPAQQSLALDILSRQHYPGLIYALPIDSDHIEDHETPLRVYSKSGSLRRARHDAGILARGDRAALAVVLSEAEVDLSFNPGNQGAQLIAEVGAWVYRRWLA